MFYANMLNIIPKSKQKSSEKLFCSSCKYLSKNSNSIYRYFTNYENKYFFLKKKSSEKINCKHFPNQINTCFYITLIISHHI